MKKMRIEEVIVVEGKYDAAKLADLVDGLILTTNGFSVFKNEETKRLLDSGALAGTAAQAIGYKELLGYLQGDAPLADCVALLKQRSRNYAKRQLTWLKRDDNIHWIYYNKGEELPSILQEATKYLQNHGVQ